MGRREARSSSCLGPVTLLLVGALSFASGCQGGTRTPAAPSAPASSWYLLKGGRLETSSRAPATGTLEAGSSSDSAPRFLPWTVQDRIADLLVRSGRLYLAVNGHGVASAPFPLEPDSSFSTAYAPRIFGSRTITEIMPDSTGIMLHLYVNRTLAVPTAAPPADGPFSFVAYRDQASDDAPTAFVPLAVPFQAAHPTWEAVAIVRTSADELAVEWKRSEEERTEFAYTRLRWRTGTEANIDRETFRNDYGLVPLSSSGVDPSVKALFDAVLRHLGKPGPATRSTAVHLVLRSDGGETERYRYQPVGYADQEDVDLVTVPGRRTTGALWALTADGALFAVAAGSREVSLQNLPPLPESLRYTGFALTEDPARPAVAASWEEVLFTKVGSAGLYAGVIRLPGR